MEETKSRFGRQQSHSSYVSELTAGPSLPIGVRRPRLIPGPFTIFSFGRKPRSGFLPVPQFPLSRDTSGSEPLVTLDPVPV